MQDDDTNQDRTPPAELRPEASAHGPGAAFGPFSDAAETEDEAAARPEESSGSEFLEPIAVEEPPVVSGNRDGLADRLPVGRWSPVHPDYKTVLVWLGLIRTAIFAVILAVATLPIWFGEALPGNWFWIWPPLVLVILGLSLTHALTWPRRTWNALLYRFDESGIEIRQGVIWRASTVVACSRIQHTEVIRGPLQRVKGLATLVIHTAGNANDTVDLPGLEDETAQALRDWLIAESARVRGA